MNKKSKLRVIQPKDEQLNIAFKLVAYSRLKENNLRYLDIDRVEGEAARIERCVEYQYKLDVHDYQYKEFASVFLQKNFKEFVFGAEFLGNYIDDVPEPKKEINNTMETLQ